MSTQTTNAPLGCLQAARVYAFLRDVNELPDFGAVFSTDFAPSTDEQDLELISALIEEGLLITSPTLSEKFRAYFGRSRRQIERAREHADIRRALQTTEVQIRHATEKSDRGRLLKSKSARWEEASTLGTLEKKKAELIRKESAIVSGDQDLTSQYEVLRAALEDSGPLKLYGQTLVQLTHQGRYLLAILDTFSKRHLNGRRLGDILAVGPLLAE